MYQPYRQFIPTNSVMGQTEIEDSNKKIAIARNPEFNRMLDKALFKNEQYAYVPLRLRTPLLRPNGESDYPREYMPALVVRVEELDHKDETKCQIIPRPLFEKAAYTPKYEGRKEAPEQAQATQGHYPRTPGYN
jgi:hypothetical protein